MIKKLFSVSFFLVALTIVSCKKSSTSSNDSGIKTDSLYVSLSTNTLEYNGFDYTKVIVKDKAGNDITSSCSLILDNSQVIKSNFTPSKTGTFKINAVYQQIPSTFVSLKVNPKSASPFTQKVLLEDCTGTWCGYCPRAADLIETYKSNHPNCISLAIHGGNSSDPFLFQYFSSFNSRFAVQGYPTVILNRKSEWSEDPAEIDALLTKWAPLGLSIASTINNSTINGTVKVKFNVNTDKALKIVVALVENGLVYPQTNYYSIGNLTPYLYDSANPVNNFVHNGVLRRTATNLFGDAIPATSQLKNNIYELPFSIPVSGNTAIGTYTANAAKCGIIAYVCDANNYGATNSLGILNVQYADAGTTKNFD